MNNYSITTTWAFDYIENKHSLCGREDFKENFYEYLREHAENIIDFEKKKNVAVNKRRTKITSRCKSML